MTTRPAAWIAGALAVAVVLSMFSPGPIVGGVAFLLAVPVAVAGSILTRRPPKGRAERDVAEWLVSAAAASTGERTSPDGAEAENAIAGDHPFIMQSDGRSWLFVPQGLEDGPMPAHYEPHESPFDNPLYSQRANPARQQFDRAENRYNPSNGDSSGSKCVGIGPSSKPCGTKSQLRPSDCMMKGWSPAIARSASAPSGGS